MKAEFKSGDRVIIYGGAMKEWDNLEFVACDGARGTVTHFNGGNMYVRDVDGAGGNIVVHPKQCRRLKKKTRRTVWIKKAGLDEIFLNQQRGHASMLVFRLEPASESYGESVEFREVIRKK